MDYSCEYSLFIWNQKFQEYMYIFKVLKENPSEKIGRCDETALNLKNNDKVCLGGQFIVNCMGCFKFLLICHLGYVGSGFQYYIHIR